MINSYSIKVIGKVQGVGFRYYTHQKANELGVKGFVKNMRDGSVFIEAEANAMAMDEFISWVRKGPSWARVDDVQIQEKPVESFIGFDVR